MEKNSNNKKIKQNVKNFWNSSPCGTYLINQEEGTKEYYNEIDNYRYNKYPYKYNHIPKYVSFEKWKNKKVLEIGCSVGTDLSQFAKCGAIVTGIDLTSRGIDLAKKRFEVLGLTGDFRIADAEKLPFENNYFDLVYSFGVLHHTPETQKAIDEIYRVLKPGGTTIIMLYHKRSLEYAILNFRRLKNVKFQNTDKTSAINQLTETNKSPDGPINPLTKMYTKAESREFFHNFQNVEINVDWVRIPFIGCFTGGLSKIFGWHIMINAKK